MVGAGSAWACASLSAPGVACAAGGAPRRTIRVKLFAGLTIVRLDVSGLVPLSLALGAGQISAAQVTFDAAAGTLAIDGRVAPLKDPVISIGSPAPFAVQAASNGGRSLSRRYNGSLAVAVQDGALTLINDVDIDSYVASTLASEISPGWAVEAVKAQAIAARTYAARAADHAKTRAFDVTDDTSSQVYRGLDGIAPAFSSAVAATSGLILTAGGAPADVFYSSSCGGHTAGSIELTGRPGPPYLEGIADADASGRAYCASAPYFAWKNSIARDAMARALEIPADRLAGVSVAERWPGGRVKRLRVSRADGPDFDFDGRRFYVNVAEALGYKVLPSSLFDIALDGSAFAVTGHGLGHGVGMCQWGARGRADAGMTAEAILAAYFPGTKIT
jgi:stage II sporulation protein D